MKKNLKEQARTFAASRMSNLLRIPNNWKTRSLILAAVVTLFRLLIIGYAGPGDSESYYWTWSRHLDWSYYDHPPMVAYLIRLSTAIGGDGMFWTRLPSGIIFAGICCFVFFIARDLFDEETGFWALLILNLVPMISVAAMQIVPDVPAAFFWFLFVYLVVRILKDDKELLWYPAGAVIGLGLLSKYMILPLVPVTLLMLAWHGEYRKHLKRPHIYLGGVLGLFFFSPVLIWNFINDFPSFRFHLVERHQNLRHFEPGHIAEFLGGQALYVSPLLWFGFLYVVYRCGRSLFVEKDLRFAALFWYSAVPLAFFYFISMWTKESEPHWTAFGYLTAIIAWAAFFVQSKERWRKYAFASLSFSLLLIVVFYIHFFFTILPIKPKFDIVNELFGWDAVATQSEEMLNDFPAKNQKFLMAHHWVMCSQLTYATQNRLPVYCVNDKTDQFDFFPDNRPPEGGDFVFIADNRFKNPPEKYYDFDKREPPREIKINRNGKRIRTFYLYKVYGYIGKRQ
ncbi:MAG: hypothetical protein IEMM0002_0992 [bacterium]|nr:MAG: hypothetical protein IEMM0002_0992 [bacterium]